MLTLTLSTLGLPLAGAEGQRLIVYLARPGTPDHDAMTLLDILAAGHATAPRLVPPAGEFSRPLQSHQHSRRR